MICTWIPNRSHLFLNKKKMASTNLGTTNLAPIDVCTAKAGNVCVTQSFAMDAQAIKPSIEAPLLSNYSPHHFDKIVKIVYSVGICIKMKFNKV